jgi:hypothetical protein
MKIFCLVTSTNLLLVGSLFLFNSDGVLCFLRGPPRASVRLRGPPRASVGLRGPPRASVGLIPVRLQGAKDKKVRFFPLITSPCRVGGGMPPQQEQITVQPPFF